MIASGQSLAGGAARRGTVLPVLVFTIVVLVAFLALAIDLGMLATAKAQAQNAADLAALTAARTLNGNSTTGSPNNGAYNQNNATTNAQNILTYNTILGQQIQTSQLALTFGSYDYNDSTQTFSANYPPTAGKPYTAVAATVTAASLPGAFSNIFGTQLLPSVTATAQAVHRPRDIALTLDLSGSMRFGTLLGFDFASTSRVTNNPDTLVPTFGHYSSSSASLIGTTSTRTSSVDNYTITPSNSTAANSTYSLTYVNSFYQNAAYASTLIRAFDSYSSTDGGNTWTAPTTQRPQLPPASYATAPGGDAPLFLNGSTTTYATSVKDVLNTSSTNILWELDGYSAYAAGLPDTSTNSTPKVWTQVDYSATGCQFNGYTQGPGYYGKTFFLWPPDPRTTTALSGSTLTSYLSALGVNAADQTVLSNIWATWQGQGVGPGSTGLTNLQNWLKGTATGGASALPTFAGGYTPTSTTAFVPGFTTWKGTTLTSSNKPLTYYAVCRLFNRAYPAGSTWSGSTLSTGTSFHADWRMRFFGTTNNSTLFSSNGSLNTPGSGYSINYNAILAWIAGSADPFPTQMRAGRVKFYSSIPTAITGTWPSYGGTDQRFWVEFIDYALGFRQLWAGAYGDLSGLSSGTPLAGYGVDFTWPTATINSPPSAPQYMYYQDNPARPRLRFWFGPMLMTDYLHNSNFEEILPTYYNCMQAGDHYEAPLYTAKQSYVAAINTMEYNHPNDWVSVVAYSWPKNSATGGVGSAGYVGRFNCVRSPLGPNYAYASASLLFPFSTINADGSCNNTEITPYDADPATGLVPSANFADTPRAEGDTCFAMALMLCYNQFAVTPTSDTTLRTFVTSSPITFPTGMAGGLGRKGAQKVIIFETDGLANTGAAASLVNAGSYSYYQIRYDMNKPSSSEYPTLNVADINDSGVLSQVYGLVQQLGTTYGTTRNPFRLYAIGFGPVFAGPDASSALSTLQTMQYYAGTQTSPTTALPSNQVINGTDAQMTANMTAAFTTILENGVQIALIK
jgi:Flp pilus assembly protein TadG